MSVTQADMLKACTVCNGQCIPLITSNIVSSEFYCGKCHKSYPMNPEVVQVFNEIAARQMPRQPPQPRRQ